jgi:DNA-binding LacI/PurR family transcriptional regulator
MVSGAGGEECAVAVTQRQIAEEAGVSVTTVSFVLTGRAGEMNVSAATARRVAQVAQDLGYEGNYHARALSTGRSLTLGFANPSRAPHEQQFSMALAGGVERRARERGYDLLFFSSGAEEVGPIGHAARVLAERRIDGLIMPHVPPRTLRREREKRWPVVFVQTAAENGYPAVNLDAGPGLAAAVAHLAELGHRRLVWIGPADEGADRPEAVRSAAAGRGLECEVRRVAVEMPPGLEVDRQIALYRRALAGLGDVPGGATAAVCYNEALALGLYAMLGERGLRVPGDVSVVGFDDLLAASALPAMSTVSHMLGALGAAAVDLVLDILEREQPYPLETEVRVPARFIARASTGPPGERSG